MRQNLPLHWVCEKGEKEKEIPPFFPAVISLITSLAKGHSINKNVLFVHFMQVTLKVMYETEGLLHFLWTKTTQIPDDAKDSREETIAASDWRQQPCAAGSSNPGCAPGPRVHPSSLCVLGLVCSGSSNPDSYSCFLPTMLSYVRRSEGHKIVFYYLLYLAL